MTPERKIKTKIMDYLRKKAPGFWFPYNPYYGMAGIPDIIGCLEGRFVGIEAKTADGKMSPLQLARQKSIEATGGVYILARSVDDVKRIINLYQGE